MIGVADVTAATGMKPAPAGALRATAIVVEKEFRILRRDWVGMCLLILAPILVITVAERSGAGEPRPGEADRSPEQRRRETSLRGAHSERSEQLGNEMRAMR